jgi:hypothetical protein
VFLYRELYPSESIVFVEDLLSVFVVEEWFLAPHTGFSEWCGGWNIGKVHLADSLFYSAAKQ